MNHFDQLVKESIIGYTVLFQTRWQVLRHIFLVNGNGYEWDMNGNLVHFSRNSEEKDDTNYFVERIEKDPVATEFQEIMRDFIRDNIDSLSTNLDVSMYSPYMPQPTVKIFDNYYSKYTLINQACLLKKDNENWDIEPNIKIALKEFINLMIQTLEESAYDANEDYPHMKGEEAWKNKEHYKHYIELLNSKETLF